MVSTLLFLALVTPRQAKPALVFPADAYLTTPIPNLVNTEGTSTKVGSILRVDIKKAAVETNATQLTISNTIPLVKGHILRATLKLRGAGKSAPARIELLFERATSPWTKSLTEVYSSNPDPLKWRSITAIFRLSESYEPNQAMLSIRFATQIQKVEIDQVKLAFPKETVAIYNLR